MIAWMGYISEHVGRPPAHEMSYILHNTSTCYKTLRSSAVLARAARNELAKIPTRHSKAARFKLERIS